MKKYILISGGQNDVREVEGFYDSVKEALKDASDRGLVEVEIYELAENAYNLAEEE